MKGFCLDDESNDEPWWSVDTGYRLLVQKNSRCRLKSRLGGRPPKTKLFSAKVSIKLLQSEREERLRNSEATKKISPKKDCRLSSEKDVTYDLPGKKESFVVERWTNWYDVDGNKNRWVRCEAPDDDLLYDLKQWCLYDENGDRFWYSRPDYYRVVVRSETSGQFRLFSARMKSEVSCQS